MDSKVSNTNLIDWDVDETFHKISELPPLESILELDSFASNKQSSNLDEWEYNWSTIGHQTDELVGDNYYERIKNMGEINNYENEKKKKELKRVNGSGRKRRIELEMKEIQKNFHLPITKAAKEMKVGLTVLKKRCRELNIFRWPHRKIKSLKTLIHNVKEMGMKEEIEMLEEHKRLVEEWPDAELTPRTKKLRQACFKANYKKKRCLLSTL